MGTQLATTPGSKRDFQSIDVQSEGFSKRHQVLQDVEGALYVLVEVDNQPYQQQ